MKIEIFYCAAWDFKPQAAGLSAEINKALKATVRLVPGSNGIFNVVADGKLLFSRDEIGRFPEPGEIVAKLNREADWFENAQPYAL